MKKLLFLALLVLSTTTLFAEEIATSSAGLYDTLKKSPVKLELMSHHMTMRNRDKEIAGSDNLMDVLVSYKFDTQNTLRLDAGVQHLALRGDRPSEDFKETYFNTLELNYIHKWLKEGEYNPSLVTENRINYIPSARFRDYDQSHGNTHHRLTVSKNFKNFNLTNQYRFQVNEHSRHNGRLIRNYTRIYLTPSYYFTQNFGMNITNYWAEEVLVDQPKKGRGYRTNSFIRVAPGIDFFASNFMISLYGSYKIGKSHDDRFLRDDYLKDPIIGLILTASVF